MRLWAAAAPLLTALLLPQPGCALFAGPAAGPAAEKLPRARLADKPPNSGAKGEGREPPPPKPEGPLEKPAGRHLQYFYVNTPHGLTERLTHHFTLLLRVSKYHDAHAHIHMGHEGAGVWLDRTHSREVASGWDRYFDIKANGGSPFHPLKNFKGCKNVHKEDASLLHLFDKGHLCVNIWVNIYGMKWSDVPEGPVIPPSLHVLQAAQRFMTDNKMPQEYGSIHIRRCDRIGANTACTAPNTIYKAIKENNNYTTWVAFLYAEDGYAEKLEQALKPLGRRILFEDRLTLNHMFPDDNYFTYLVGKYLTGAAKTILETHLCAFNKLPRIMKGGINGLVLSRVRNDDDNDEEADADSELQDEAAMQAEHLAMAGEGAVCDTSSWPPRLFPRPVAEKELRTSAASE